MKSFFIFLAYFTLSISCFSQKEANIWHFGSGAALDFSSGTPMPISGSMIDTHEGSASISDSAGNLLFYTDGVSVWNKNNIQMPNGFGLLGNTSSSQSALIVKKPGSKNIFYIFTTSPDELRSSGQAPTPLCYSEVDMNLSGGLGDVTNNKNVILSNNSCEKLAGTTHCNKSDIWVITQDIDSTSTTIYKSFLVSSMGINTTPVETPAGLGYNYGFVFNHSPGCMKFSPDGTRLVSTSKNGEIELFYFDSSTGIISNKIYFINYACPYGVEFSPDGTKLYLSNCNTYISQADLSVGSPPHVLNSIPLSTDHNNPYGQLQLGPDNKIYCARLNSNNTSNYISVINNPNILGPGCNFVDSAIYIGPGNCQEGLPNFVWYKKVPDPTIGFSYITPVCKSGTNPTPINVSGFTSSGAFIASPAGLSIDSISGILNLSASNAGKYTITYSYPPIGCVPDASWSTSLEINPPIAPAIEFSYPDICVLDTMTTSPKLVVGFITGGKYTSTNGIVIDSTTGEINGNSSIPGTYSVTYTYKGSPTACIASGINTTNVSINQAPCNRDLGVPNAFSPNKDGTNDQFCLEGWDDFILEFQINIFNRWGELVYRSMDPNFCWDGVYKGKVLDPGVYAYFIKASFLSAEDTSTNQAKKYEVNKKGNISLIY